VDAVHRSTVTTASAATPSSRPTNPIPSPRVAFTLTCWGERPIACVVFKKGASAPPEALTEHLRGEFAKWQLPDRYEALEAIPRTSTGKFSKLRLREMFPR